MLIEIVKPVAFILCISVQLFFWTSTIMLVLFIVSWYLESHCTFYRDVRF